MRTHKAEVSQPIPSQPPIMTEGKVTPEVVSDFEHHARIFFLHVKGKLSETDQVIRILGSFHDPLIRDWVATNGDTLSEQTFDDFMESFREQWLPDNWEETVHTNIISSRLDPAKEKFETWVTRIRKMNVTLRGTSSHFSITTLRKQLEACLDPPLILLAKAAKVNEDKILTSWINKIQGLDRKRQQDRKQRFEEMSEFMRPKRPYTTNRPPQENRQALSSTRQGENPFPPPLTEVKRQLLRDHDGCFKCRHFYVGHRSAKCTTTISGKGYKTLTAKDAERAKADRGTRRQPPVAAIASTDMKGDSDSDTPLDTVAAIFDPDEDEDDLNDNSMSVSLPLKCPHLLWECALTGTTGVTRANALINSGAHLVLIRLSLVKRLGLQ
jgi:hypothetical protein